MKIETGVMIFKDGKCWGDIRRGGHSSSEGWVEPEDAKIRDPRFCKRVEDAAYPGSPYLKELRKGVLVAVERRTEVIITKSSRA